MRQYSYLNDEAYKDFQTKIEQFSVPKELQCSLAVGVFYLHEWKRLAAAVHNGISPLHYDGGLNGDLQYMQQCFDNWMGIARTLGMLPSTGRGWVKSLELN